MRQQTPSKKRKPATTDTNAADSKKSLVISGLKKFDRGWVILQTKMVKKIALMDNQKSRFLTAVAGWSQKIASTLAAKMTCARNLFGTSQPVRKASMERIRILSRFTAWYRLETLVYPLRRLIRSHDNDCQDNQTQDQGVKILFGENCL